MGPGEVAQESKVTEIISCRGRIAQERVTLTYDDACSVARVASGVVVLRDEFINCRKRRDLTRSGCCLDFVAFDCLMCSRYCSRDPEDARSCSREEV